jgi:hypothetical protein
VPDQVSAVDGERVERAADEGGVRVDGLPESGGRARVPEAWRVPGHRTVAELGDGGEQVSPVRA